MDYSTDRIGIGTTSPTAKFEVDGSAIFNESGAAVDFRVEGDTEENLLFVDGSADKVGIGTSSPTEKLHVVGNICFTGISASCSDVRYKKDFDIIGSALDKISKIDGYTYNFRVDEFPENDFDSTRQVGFKAQEIQEVLPQVVLENDSGYLSVDYGKVTPLLLMAIKEQQAIIEVQKKEIETQKAELELKDDELKAELDSKTSTNADKISELEAQVQQLLQLIQQQESASVVR